jgi:hypothetical protein
MLTYGKVRKTKEVEGSRLDTWAAAGVLVGAGAAVAVAKQPSHFFTFYFLLLR